MVVSEPQKNLLLSITPDHEMLLKTVREFARKEIAPIAEKLDEKVHAFSQMLIEKNSGQSMQLTKQMQQTTVLLIW